MIFFKKKTKEELKEEITRLKADKVSKEEYKALLHERNELKYGKWVAGSTSEEKEARKVKFKAAWDKLGKLSEANAEYGMDMGESKSKQRGVRASNIDGLADDMGFLGSELISSRKPSKRVKGAST